MRSTKEFSVTNTNSNPHPLIYLRAVKSELLEVPMDYIYQVKVKIVSKIEEKNPPR